MNPERLRLIDRLAGRPMVRVISLLLPLFRLFWRPSSPVVGRTLLLLLSESGSLLLTEGALRRLKVSEDRLPGLVTFDRNRDALGLMVDRGLADGYTLHCTPLWRLPFELLRLRRWARENGFNSVIDLEPGSNLTALLALASGSLKRAGFHFPGESGRRRTLYTTTVQYNPHHHIAVNYLQLAERLLVASGTRRRIATAEHDLSPYRPSQPLPDWLEDWLDQSTAAGGQLLLVNPNASAMLPQRRWPEAAWRELVERLLSADNQLAIAVVGGEEDRDTTARLTAGLDRNRMIDLAGRLDLRGFVGLCWRAAALVGNDSGPSHFASLTPISLLVLFGPETPTLYRPLSHRASVISAGLACSPCIHPLGQRLAGCQDAPCMQGIGVDQVERQLQHILASEAGRVSGEVVMLPRRESTVG